jgi:hypothetical protein
MRLMLHLAPGLALGIGTGLTDIAVNLLLLGGSCHEPVEFMGAGLGFLAAGVLTFFVAPELASYPEAGQ